MLLMVVEDCSGKTLVWTFQEDLLDTRSAGDHSEHVLDPLLDNREHWLCSGDLSSKLSFVLKYN